MNANREWINLINKLNMSPNKVSPRGMQVKELIAHQTMITMDQPRVTWPDRKISERFMFAEAAWILSGDNQVRTIAPYNKNISPYSDDGVRYFGAYGPKIIDQLSYVVSKLAADTDTRQAVINIWRENPPQTKDVPCTLSLQFLIRQGMLWCVATMRSSDAWLGWPYDVFNFSMIARAVAIYYKQVTRKDLQLGYLVLTAGSQHLYEQHWEKAREVFSTPLEKDIRDDKALDPSNFIQVADFVNTLWNVARDSLEANTR